MSVKILIDMNLSPEWVALFAHRGIDSVHWSTVGDSRATDLTIMSWALANGYVVFTHDLDFGTVLALTHSTGPSVIQVRVQDTLSETTVQWVAALIKQHERDLSAGALVIIDPPKSRVRILPI